MSFVPNEHEETFKVTPIGVKYICEFCGKGEMIAVNDEPVVIPAANMAFMIKHRCNKCNGELMLPKTYPYIEWIPVDDKIENKEKENGSD